ncbi:MAG: hypothetical protein E6Q68_04750 [Polynucleobacter sp.]|nr:MAG: hypothetical protein E6Q68_04750 [Polynucleobacter sp.]
MTLVQYSTLNQINTMPRGRKRKEESATAPAAVQETPSTSTTTVDVTPETPKESPAVVTVTPVAEVVTVTEDTAKVEPVPADIPVAAPAPSEEKAKKYVQAVDSNGHVRKFYDYFDTPTNRVKVTRLLQAKGISVKEFVNS